MPIRPRPEVHYKATKTLVQGGEAAMIVEALDKNYATMRLVIENGEWKIAEQIFSNVPPDPRSLYALVPPPDGAFARAGSPWQNVARSSPPNLGWRLQATRDQSYVYVRIESDAPLPAANSEVSAEAAGRIDTGVPRRWPVMKIAVVGKASREYRFDITANVGDRATFDPAGKANSHFHFVAYSFNVSLGDNRILDVSANGKLITVGRNSIDVRIPLKSIDAEAATRITIADANQPGSSIQPYPVTAFVP